MAIMAEYGFLIVALLGVGCLTGFLAGLLGIGGGIILVPSLYYSFVFLGFDPAHMMHMAVGTSLAIMVPTGLSSTRAHWKRGGVRFDLLKQIGIGILCGVVIGTSLANHLSGQSLKGIFACALFVLAWLMFNDPARYLKREDISPQPWPALFGGGVGTLASLMGIGGAVVTVPYMTAHRVPVRTAIGTAAALGLCISIPAMAGFMMIGADAAGRPPFSLGYINGLAWLVIVPATVMMAPVGAHVAHKVPVDRLRRLFAVIMILVAVNMLYGAFRG